MHLVIFLWFVSRKPTFAIPSDRTLLTLQNKTLGTASGIQVLVRITPGLSIEVWFICIYVNVDNLMLVISLAEKLFV